MLKLAKTESKKEMTLKRRNKTNTSKNNIILKKKMINKNVNKNIMDTYKIPNNKNTSTNRITHKIVKKAYISNKPNISTQKNQNNIPKPNPIIFINNNKIMNLKAKSPKHLSPIHRNKEISSLKRNNTCDINLKRKSRSVKNKSKKGKIKRPLTSKNSKDEENRENMLKTVENGRIRKLFSMASDIFNLDDTATNLIKRCDLSPKYSNFYKTIYKKDINNNNFRDSLNQSGLNQNNNHKYNNSLSNNILAIARKKNNKKHNRINFFKRSEYNPNETYLLHPKGLKTNRSNLESVKYDIISTRKSNIVDKYNNLSGLKASSSNVEDYEILVPKNYNTANVNHLKNVLNSNGLHIFGLKEEGDLIGGQKGKFKIKVRTNGQNEKDKDKCINKIKNKLSNMDVKLKKKIVDLRKKKTDITGYGWEEEIKNGLH